MLRDIEVDTISSTQFFILFSGDVLWISLPGQESCGGLLTSQLAPFQHGSPTLTFFGFTGQP